MCDSRISLENGGFDVRWVRFQKYILLFSRLSELELVSLGDSYDSVQ